jgi:hypothetical protein
MGVTRLSSEQRLILAVLVDAIKILQKWEHLGSKRSGRHELIEAAEWVNTRLTDNPSSFDNICDALSIDSEALRAKLSDLIAGHANTAELEGV